MLRPIPAITVALCFLALPLQGHGEDLLQIYDIAVESDPTLGEAEQILASTREVKPQARALLLPSFGIEGSVQRLDTKTSGTTSSPSLSYDPSGGWPLRNRFSFTSKEQDFDRNETYTQQSVSAVVTQSVFDRANWIRLSQTDATIAQAEAQYNDAQVALMVRTTEAYFAVLRAADGVRVQEALVRANERTLEQSKQRFDVGLVAITDVNESQAAYDRSRANLIAGENALGNAWEALRVIVGPIRVPIARLGQELPLAPPEPNDIDQWVETAFQNNYSIVAAQQAATAAKKQIEIERSGHLPTLDLQAGYNWDRSNAQFGTDTDTAFVGLQVSVPIFQGGAVTSRTRQAGHDYSAAQDRLDQQRRAVLNLVKDSFRGILSNISDVEARQAAIVSARSALESTQAGLEVGTRTQVDVLNAQQRLFEAEFDYLSARYDYIINGVKLHQATSTLTREVLAKANAWLDPGDAVPPPAY
ncbi:type I secretion outer membrane protein, TolC family [Thioflavicoccus mobilis 8321]|uniref:Type I secretion outer membrane protein, TolC family n=1 Tax=Thioflavicoccus mobilis 8321 TaxID=765912 RepID=L0GX71_9GAMM|nr:TolC family outer membrane protein [Thioflavicoccus mobilis]AGA89904.1 type I secretion outer membrane protein, TolC family [Thioflavicoccus mobilis 8321]